MQFYMQKRLTLLHMTQGLFVVSVVGKIACYDESLIGFQLSPYSFFLSLCSFPNMNIALSNSKIILISIPATLMKCNKIFVAHNIIYTASPYLRPHVNGIGCLASHSTFLSGFRQKYSQKMLLSNVIK